MIRDTASFSELVQQVRRFVRERLVPREAEVEEHDRVPPDVIASMRELGLFGLSIPEEYGGLGLTMEEEVQVVFELCWAAPAFRSVVGSNIGIGSQGIVMEGSPEQKARYLPRLASGELVGSFGLTEPDAGSDAAALRTTARRDGAHYVLNGRKRFITNAPHAGLFTLMARTDPSTGGAGGVSAFLVEAPRAGLSLGTPERKMGQRGAHICDVVFDDCRIPASSLLGPSEGRGFKIAMRVLDRGRIHLAAMAVGAAQRMLDEALGYARERRQFGKAIGEFQLVQAMLADSYAEIYAARAMVVETARARDAGRDIATEAACCKLFATEMCGRVADRALQVHGGAGYIKDYAIERFYRDVRVFRIYEGTSQIQQLLIARNLLRG